MALKRIMPCLLYDGHGLVKTVQFKNPQYIGDPLNAIRIYNEKEVDELVILDIRASKQGRSPDFDLIRSCASECFMPLSYGGGVASLAHFGSLYRIGVEKVIVNTLCFTNPGIVAQATKKYGSTSVVGAVDYKKAFLQGNRVVAPRRSPRRALLDHCRFMVEELGVGELLVYSVDRDGTWTGFDIDTVRAVVDAVAVPVIASGGAGSIGDIRQLFRETNVNAAALGSMAVYQRKGMGVLINFPQRHLVIDDPIRASG